MDQQQNNPWNENNADAGQDGEQAAPAQEQSAGQQQAAAHSESQGQGAADGEATGGADEHKTLAIVGYILPILFFLPLLKEESKNDPFARFHANQQLILLITALAVYILSSMFFRMFFMGGYFIMDLINLAYLVLVIIGIINATKGEMKELPVIGGFQLLK